MFFSGRSILAVKHGIDPTTNKKIVKVGLNQQTAVIEIVYAQYDLIERPGDSLETVSPEFSLLSVPEGEGALAHTVQEITDLCVEQLGAPKGQAFDVVEFLRQSVVPRVNQAMERVN